MALFKITITSVLLLAFAFIFGLVLYDTWNAAATPNYLDLQVFIATGLAGYVGGIVAAAFGVKPPANAGNPQSRFAQNMRALGNTVGAGSQNVKTTMATAYVAVYVLIGVASLVVVWFNAAVVCDILKNFLTVSVGLFFAVGQSYFIAEA